MTAGDRMSFRVGITGSYGGLNMGDEAILEVIVRELRDSLPVEITVFSRDAADTLARHRVERAVPVRDLSRQEVLPEIERLDLLIFGGGGILFDSEVKAFLREVDLAHESGVPVVVYAVGAGPLKDQVSQTLVRENLNRAAVVTVRERDARKVLEDAGVKRDIIVTADPALLLTPEPIPDDALAREGIAFARPLVGVSVREPGTAAPDIDEDQYHVLLANAADYVVERFGTDLVFVPMEPHVMDSQQSHAVIARMANAKRAHVLKGDYTPGQLLSIMGRLHFAIGMRLHFLIFAALQRLPFVALPYGGKVSGFLDMIEMKTVPMEQMDAGRLIAHIDRSWDRQDELRERIDRRLPELQHLARENNRIVVQLLERLPAAGRAA